MTNKKEHIMKSAGGWWTAQWKKGITRSKSKLATTQKATYFLQGQSRIGSTMIIGTVKLTSGKYVASRSKAHGNSVLGRYNSLLAAKHAVEKDAKLLTESRFKAPKGA